MSNKLEFDQMCKACGGTGVFQGMAEHSGVAVVCYVCKGTGVVHRIIEYESPLTRRVVKPNVKRVYQWNAGICIEEDESQGLTLESFGGISYQDWLDGKPFPPKSENRNHVCPRWWYQGVEPYYSMDWCVTKYSDNFSSCRLFCDKHLCWERFDKDRETPA